MGRNLKIRWKLLLGFGLVLFLFVASVLVVWRYIIVVENGSNLLADRVAPVLKLAADYNNRAYDVFLAMNSVQYTENREAVGNYKNQLAKIGEAESKLTAMNKAYPELPAPAHVVSVVAPLGRQYIDLSDRALAQIAKKQILLEIFSAKGAYLSETVKDMTNRIHSKLANSIRLMSLNANSSGMLASENALFQTSDLMEKIMTLRLDSWHAITVAQTGGGDDELRQIEGRMDVLRKQAENMRPLYTSEEEQSLLE